MSELKKTMSRRDVLIGGLVGAGGIALAAGSGGVANAALRRRAVHSNPGKKSTQKLTWGLSSYPTNFNPFVNAGVAAGTITTATHRGLLSYDNHGRLVPALASSVKPVGDRAYEIELVSGVRFHNGRKLTARDVAFTLDAMKDSSLGASLVAQAQEIASIKIQGDDRLVIQLGAPDASLPSYLGTPYMPIVSQKSDLSTGDIIGCGPFRLTSKQQGSTITCARFDAYYKHGYPLLPRIEFQTLANGASAVEALSSGEVDIVDSLPWSDFSSVKANAALKLLAVGGPFMYMLFNTTSGPFADPQVRNAMGYAINRAAVVADAFSGGGTPLLGTPMPKSSPYYNRDFSQYWSHDPGETKSLLAKAGYRSGISVKLLANAQYSFYQDTAVVLQSNLAQAGVNVSLVLPDWSTQEQDGISGNYDMAIMGSAGEVNDPSFLSLFLEGPPAFQRSHGFNSPQINRLLTEGLRKTATAQRKPVYDEIQRLMIEQAPIVPMNWRDQAYGVRRNVKGFANIPGFLTFYSGYTLEQTTLA